MGHKASSRGSCLGSLGLAQIDRLKGGGLALVGCVQRLRHSAKCEGGGDGDSGSNCGGSSDEYRSVSYAIGVAQVAVVAHSQQCLLTSIRLIEVRLFMGASQPSGCMS